MVLVAKKQVKVRLTEIEAPESKQPFGTRSRQSLAELCAGKDAWITEQGKDRYGRTRGRAMCERLHPVAAPHFGGMLMAEKEAKAEDPKQALREYFEMVRKGYQDIGEFMVEFSQLQFTIRAVLGGLLKLKGELFNAVTAPYGFAHLCHVTREVALVELPPERKAEIVDTFKACLALNDQRVRVAHGLLTYGDGTIESLHVSSQLKAGTYFSKPGELNDLCKESQRLMGALLKIGGGSLVLK